MQRIAALWNRGIVGKVAIGCGGVVGLVIACCVLGLVIGSQQPRQASAPAATDPPAATAALLAPTELRFNTPQPAPIDTPKPTATPQPTQAAGISPAVAVYMGHVGGILGDLSTALGDMSALLLNPKPTSDDWKIDLAAQFVAIQQQHQKLTNLQPVPSEMADIHAAILDATGDCDQATRLLTRGLDKNSVQDINEATTMIQQCGTKSQSALKQLNDYKEAHQ